MQTLNTIMLTLLIIGGLNWGLVGVAGRFAASDRGAPSRRPCLMYR